MDAPLETLMLALGDAQAARPASSVLFLGAKPHEQLRSYANVSGWQPFKPWADAWDQAGFTSHDEPPVGKWPVVALMPGKSKEEILHGFALARDRVEDGGVVVIAMPNTGGSSRFEKEFARATGTIHSLSKHKCRAFSATCDGSWNEALFDVWRALGKPSPVSDTAMATVPGVFSAGRIDEGSKFLSDHMPADLHGNVADLGAGWGFLADHVLRTCPRVEHIDLFEADSRAIACAKTNLATYGDRASYHWRDVTLGIPGAFHSVVMNPPFHTGHAQDIALGQAFLTSAAQALRPGGRLFLVANRQLPYEKTLDSLGIRCRNAGENHTFKLLFGRK